MNEVLLKIVNDIIKKRQVEEITQITLESSLRNDLGFDSFDLAELTVRIEDEFDVDIFEDGVIDRISEVMDKINRGKE